MECRRRKKSRLIQEREDGLRKAEKFTDIKFKYASKNSF